MHSDTGATEGAEKEDESRVAIQKAEKLLSRRLRVGIKDGRNFSGKLYCLDKQGNLLLSEAVEYRSRTPVNRPLPVPLRGEPANVPSLDSKYVGLILIPRKIRTFCDISEEEIESTLNLPEPGPRSSLEQTDGGSLRT